MQTIHNALSETKQRCDELSAQIAALKSAREMHESVAAALDLSAKSLASASAAILPYTKAKVRRVVALVVTATLLNVAMFAALVVLTAARS